MWSVNYTCFDMFRNCGNIHLWGLLVLSFMESSILTKYNFLAFLSAPKIFQVWYVNYNTYFGHVQHLSNVYIYRSSSTMIYRNVNFNC